MSSVFCSWDDTWPFGVSGRADSLFVSQVSDPSSLPPVDSLRLLWTGEESRDGGLERNAGSKEEADTGKSGCKAVSRGGGGLSSDPTGPFGLLLLLLVLD